MPLPLCRGLMCSPFWQKATAKLKRWAPRSLCSCHMINSLTQTITGRPLLLMREPCSLRNGKILHHSGGELREKKNPSHFLYASQIHMTPSQTDYVTLMRLPAGNELRLCARKHSNSPLLPIYRESLSGFKSWSELCTLFTDQSRDECSRHQRGFKGLFGFQQIRPCCLFSIPSSDRLQRGKEKWS